MLEHPCEVVGDEDSVKSSRKCGVDIGLWAVADHPGCTRVAGVMTGDSAVGVAVLFSKNFDRGEVGSKAGALKLVGLLGVVSFSNKDEAMPSGEVGEGGLDGGEKLDLMLGDGLGEAKDALVLFWCDGSVGELFEAVDERATKTVEPVAVGRDGGVFAVVKMLANLFGRVDTMVEVGDKRSDSTLEVDVVLPQRIVRVDEECLICRAAVGRFEVAHMPIIEGSKRWYRCASMVVQTKRFAGNTIMGKSMVPWVIEFGTSCKATLQFAENAGYDEVVE